MTTAPLDRNALGSETSPYLLQHKDNPVHWQAWGAPALEAAKRDDRPILLSIGYAACHWCHVMAHESFESDGTARVMNDLFVNIKVDREERPDLDAIYQQALALMGEHGGWPLTMFLTPDGAPFYGGTYFPPTQRYGRPAFADVLKAVANSYRTQKDAVANNVSAIRDALGNLAKPESGGRLSIPLLDQAAAAALRLVDPLHGGTAGAPKFPQPSFFRALWHAYRRTRSPLFKQAVTVTLDNLCQGGIYDHLGGGFARYSTDETWLVPHFEKMLYDNALLVELLTEAWLDTQSPLYAARVAETVSWVLSDMAVRPAGGPATHLGFASAYDADSDGEEGKYYVWTEREIDSLLGPDSASFKKIYDVTPHGNWEGATILNRRVADGYGPADHESRLAALCARLLETRRRRVPPLNDDKVLTDWNGLMIAALARAGAAFGRGDWIAAAEGAFQFILANAADGGRLLHSWRDGRARHPAVLDDYANMSRAALLLFEATANDVYLRQARSWVALANDLHWDDQAKGYFLSAADTPDLIVRLKAIQDNATPSGNGTMVEVLAKLFHITGGADYRDRAEAVANLFATTEPRELINRPTLLAGFELLQRPVQIAVVGAKEDPAAAALAAAALEVSLPTRVLLRLAPDAPLPPGHPAAGKGLVGGRAAAYVCVGQTCGLPVTEPEALSRELAAI